MDTRSKILNFGAALEIAGRPVVIVTGTFDVLRAAHAREFRAARETPGAEGLLVIVLPGSRELLTQRARAELVAALRDVDHVVAAGSVEAEGLIDSLRPEAVVRMEEEDERRLQQLRARITDPRP